MESPPPGTWLDPQPLQRDWPEPAPPLRISRRVRVGVPLLVLVVVAALLVGLGGFQQRRDQTQVMAPGAELDCVNLVYTFEAATVQRIEDLSGEPAWDVWVSGTARNPNDEPLAPLTGDFGSFSLRGEPDGEVVNVDLFQIGAEDSSRVAVPPGGSPTPLRIHFQLPGGYVPTDRVSLAAIVMEFTDNSVLGLSGGERTWNKTDDAWLVYLPVTRLPDRDT